MKSVDYSKLLRSLHVPWGTEFDPEAAVGALARDFADEISAGSVHIRLTRNPAAPSLAVHGSGVISGSYERRSGASAASEMDSWLGEAVGGQGAGGVQFDRWQGPRSVGGIKLGPGVVLFRLSIPLAGWFASVCVSCAKSEVRDGAEASWVAQLTTVLSCLVERVNHHFEEDLSTKERRAFYEELSSVAASHPTRDLRRLCEIWRRHSGADWAWLWMHNKTANKWELAGCDPVDTAEYLVGSLTTPSLLCVAEYCNRIEQHKFIENPETWRETDAATKEEFKVVLGDLLKKKGCVALDCVPLIPPPPSPEMAKTTKSAPLRIRAAVCLYYTDVRKRRQQPSGVYKLMGRLSASAIVDSYEAEQREVLFALNELTERYLSEEKSRPAERRAGYLGELRALISRHLNVEYVSVFWKDAFQNRVVCVETSGLWRGDGTQVPPGAICNVKYKPGDGITGKVFATGRIHRSEIGVSTKHKPLFTEIPPKANGERVEERVAWIVCPIPFFTGDPEREKGGPVQGVIRCAVNKTSISPGRARDFDSIQLEGLSFITRQVAPVLEAMAANMTRELSVSVIKHDLYAPIRMILDTAEELGRDLEKSRRPGEYAITDLTTSAFMAEQLVRQLDPNPTLVGKLILMPTMLEGDIVARLKAMLRHYAREEAGMTIEFGNFRNFPCLKVDRTLIERVFHNLIVNAIKYGKEGTEIRVMPLLRRDSLVVAVSNYGIGVEPDEAPYLFNGNYRSPRAQECSHGLGLGLKISKAAMEAHGGQLELTQAKDPTIFSMVFPRGSITNQ